MNRATVVILVLVLAVLACDRQVPTTVRTTPAPTVTATAEVLAEESTTPTTQWTAVVRQVQVNVREEPNGAVIGLVLSGETVNILSCNGSWCRIEEPAGYIWRGCLSDNPNRLGCTTK